ncbi:MAG: hypothetical protein ACREWG_13195 [Gammaproteobacteria bacterium]
MTYQDNNLVQEQAGQDAEPVIDRMLGEPAGWCTAGLAEAREPFRAKAVGRRHERAKPCWQRIEEMREKKWLEAALDEAVDDTIFL